MEISESQSEHEGEMSFKQKISQGFNPDGHSRSHRQAFGQEGGGSAFQHQRLVLLSLSLLNAALLIAALVIGIYCAKANDYLQIPDSAISPLIFERNYLRNQSDLIRAKVETLAALVRERNNNAQLQVQVRQQKSLFNSFQSHIEALQTQRTNLQDNKTALEKSCGRCLPGWILLKSSCYFYSHPEPNLKKNWQDSRADCIDRGGNLLVINNTMEHQLIIDNCPRVYSTEIWWQNGFWIGLTDTVTDDVWVWINGVTEVNTMYWRNGQPSRTAPQTGHCAAFLRDPHIPRTWFNADCQNHLLNWICEMQPN